MRWICAASLMVLVAGCDDELGNPLGDSVVLTVQNNTDAHIVSFQFSPCDGDAWSEILGGSETVAPGSFGSSNSLEPGCYDLYVEDEVQCFAERSAGQLEGTEFVWTVNSSNISC